jgi:hypothetical protein
VPVALTVVGVLISYLQLREERKPAATSYAAVAGQRGEKPAVAGQRGEKPSVTFSRVVTLAASSTAPNINSENSQIFERLFQRGVRRVPFPADFRVKNVRAPEIAYNWLLVEVTGGKDCITVRRFEATAHWFERRINRSWILPGGLTEVCKGQGLLLPFVSVNTVIREVGTAEDWFSNNLVVSRCVVDYKTKVSGRSMSGDCSFVFPHQQEGGGLELPGQAGVG